MNFRVAFLGDSAEDSGGGQLTHRASAFEVAMQTCKFLLRNFWQLVGSLLLPILAAGLVLYVTLSWYLSDLLLFLEVPNPRLASLALGTLAAGLFLSLFCYAIAVSSICDLAMGKQRGRKWTHLKAQRQEWRLFAAYMRLLLLVSVVFAVAFLIWAYLVPLLSIPASLSLWVPRLICIVGVIWLIARIGFLVAPVVAGSEGAVLRKSAEISARDLLRNCTLIALLLLPGMLVLVGGGYAFQLGAGSFHAALPLAGSARSMKEMLGAFVTVTTLSLLVDIVLLTVGGIAAYQTKRFQDVCKSPEKTALIDFKLGQSVPAEGPPE